MESVNVIPRIDEAAYRTVLGRFCTGVTVITAVDQSGLATGMTVGSFSSASLDPALVTFLVGRDSKTFPQIQDAGHFCVNVLSSNQGSLGRKFAKRDTDKFQDVSWTPNPYGSPVLDGVHAWIDCEIESVQIVGDHYLVVGAILGLGQGDSVDPLVFYGSSFRQLRD